MAANEYFACFLVPESDASKEAKSRPRGDIRGTQKSTPTVPLSRVVDCSFLHYIARENMVSSFLRYHGANVPKWTNKCNGTLRIQFPPKLQQRLPFTFFHCGSNRRLQISAGRIDNAVG